MPALVAAVLLAAPAPLPPDAPAWLADPFPGVWESPPEPRPAGKREVLIDVVIVMVPALARGAERSQGAVPVADAVRRCRALASLETAVLTRAVLRADEGETASLGMTVPPAAPGAAEPGWTLDATPSADGESVQLKITAKITTVFRGGLAARWGSTQTGFSAVVHPGRAYIYSADSIKVEGTESTRHVWFLAPRLGPLAR